jgi:hypothetical protein
MALTEGANQLIWLRRFIQELGIDQTRTTRVTNTSTSPITLSAREHEAALTYVHTKENTADILTKGLDV